MSQIIQIIILYSIPFVTGFVLRLRGKGVNLSWFFSTLALPAIVLFAEFALPYRGGGASMWPIAFVLGGLYGAVFGGLGVLSASFYLKKKGTPKAAKPDL